MSPQLLAMLQAIGRNTRDIAGRPCPETGARFPRDYHRPAELVRLWRGVGGSRFYGVGGSRFFPSVDGLGPGLCRPRSRRPAAM
jgi:hypothetical protein